MSLYSYTKWLTLPHCFQPDGWIYQSVSAIWLSIPCKWSPDSLRLLHYPLVVLPLRKPYHIMCKQMLHNTLPFNICIVARVWKGNVLVKMLLTIKSTIVYHKHLYMVYSFISAWARHCYEEYATDDVTYGLHFVSFRQKKGFTYFLLDTM